MDTREPRDRFNFVYTTLVILGVGTILPWNAFINAQNYKLQGNSTELAGYRDNFLSFVGIFAIAPNFILQLINLFSSTGCGSLRLRITSSILVEIVILVVTIVLAAVDSSQWTVSYFYITMASIVLLNMAAGVYQNSAYGVAACLPMKYTNAVVIGTNACGTLLSLLMIVSIAISPGLKVAGIFYFSFALLFLVILLIVYWTLYSNKFYLHHSEIQKQHETGTPQRTFGQSLKLYWSVFGECWSQCLNTFLVFFVSLAIFPAVSVQIKSLDGIFGEYGTPLYFVPVTTFFTFNVFAMLGNMFVSDKIIKSENLWIPISFRLLFIPLFLFCNYRPETRRSPVFISSDWAFWFLSVLLGLTSGFFSSLSLMYASKVVKPENAQIAGMMAGFSVIVGILVGVCFTFLWPVVIG